MTSSARRTRRPSRARVGARDPRFRHEPAFAPGHGVRHPVDARGRAGASRRSDPRVGLHAARRRRDRDPRRSPPEAGPLNAPERRACSSTPSSASASSPTSRCSTRKGACDPLPPRTLRRKRVSRQPFGGEIPPGAHLRSRRLTRRNDRRSGPYRGRSAGTRRRRDPPGRGSQFDPDVVDGFEACEPDLYRLHAAELAA